jgi:hypothetical protein
VVLGDRPETGAEAWYSLVVPSLPVTEKAQLVVLADDPEEVGFTGPGSAVGPGSDAELHTVTDAGQLPLTAGATCTESELGEDVAQLTYADVWVRSVT